MSLTLPKVHRLQGKGFDKLYSEHHAKWKAMAEKAKQHVRSFIGPKEKVRLGDVAAILQNAIQVDPDFENYVNTKTLSQRYWLSDFTEYVLEQAYPPHEM